MTFIFNNENIKNSYGFFLLNSGMRGERFAANPVMLYNHSMDKAIGRWENLNVEGAELRADSVFDEEDEFASKISGQVSRGFIKGVSIRLAPYAAEWRENTITGESELYVTDWELMESSIAPLPSNAGSLALSLVDSSTNKLVGEDEVLGFLGKVVELSASGKTNIIKNKTMEFTKEFYKSLSLQEGADSTAIELAVGALIASKTTAESEVQTLRTEAESVRTTQIENYVQLAVDQGKILPTQKAQYITLAAKDFESVKGILDSMEARQSLVQKLSAASGSPTADYMPKELSRAEWDRLHKSNRLAALKSANEDMFNQLKDAAFAQ